MIADPVARIVNSLWAMTTKINIYYCIFVLYFYFFLLYFQLLEEAKENFFI